SSGVGIACANTSCVLNLRLEAEDPELRDEVLAHPIMLCAANRMRPLRDRAHMLHCALCRKRSLRSICSKSGRWTTRALCKHDADCHQEKRNDQPLNRTTFHRDVVTSRYTSLPSKIWVSTFTLRIASGTKNDHVSEFARRNRTYLKTDVAKAHMFTGPIGVRPQFSVYS